MMSLLKLKKQISITQLLLIILLIATIAIGAIPSYLNGKWSWSDLPKIDNVNVLKNLQKTGLTLPEWKTIQQQERLIGGNQWSVQIIEKPEQKPAILLLMPQDYYKNHPQVEWTDIQGLESWNSDSQKVLNLNSDRVKANFFRAWNQNTFAIVQWYAWPGGGHYSTWQWFLADLRAQLSRRRVPWVAVCLKIPIEPLESVESTETFVRSLSETVQATLDKEIFAQM
jgi:cyanoexosortase B-associated protein